MFKSLSSLSSLTSSLPAAKSLIPTQRASLDSHTNTLDFPAKTPRGHRLGPPIIVPVPSYSPSREARGERRRAHTDSIQKSVGIGLRHTKRANLFFFTGIGETLAQTGERER